MNQLKPALLICLLALVACSTAPRSGSEPVAGDRKASAEAIRNLGEAYLAGGNLTAALRELKRAEGIDPDDHITQFDIGLVYLYRERYDQAIQHLQRAITLKPDFAPAINSLGNAYLAKGDWDRAIEAYQRIIEDVFYGTPHFALSNMGLAYYQKKDYAEAEKHFQEALKMNPDFVNALAGLATTYMATGRYDDAIAKLERAVRKEPKLPHLHLELGKAYEGKRNLPKAREEYQRAAELAPDSPLGDDAQRAVRRLGQP
jgi:type IV pilus biogenesis/stability protein PilW